MLNEKLKNLMKLLEVNNPKLAECAGFDRTNISKMVSGARVPAPGSATSQKLINALFKYADENGRIEALAKEVGVEAPDNAELIKRAVESYLYEEYSEPEKSRRVYDRKQVYRMFGEKLDALMTIADLSNIRLSRLVSVDASLISRYRTGIRTSQSNKQLTEKICSVIFERIVKAKKLDKAAALTKIPEDELDAKVLALWLMYDETEHSEEYYAVEFLMEAFDSYTIEAGLPLPSLEEAAPAQILSDDETMYYGIEGLRTAVIRFLGNAAMSGGKQLLLYSGQDMSWMVGDPSYFMKWAALMIACVKRGIKITNIHNINRNIQEMFSGIKSWIPLYMTGMVESYYFKKAEESRFAHTIFLCPGVGCIEASPAMGMEHEGIYHYHTRGEALEHYGRTYAHMLSEAKPLVKILDANDMPSHDGGVTIVHGSLSIPTMPKELIDSFDLPELTRQWEWQRKEFRRYLKEGCINECVPIAGDDEIFGGKVLVSEFGRSGEEKPLYYTPEQYSMHIRKIIEVLDKYRGYNLIPLEHTPFENINMIVSPGCVSVTRTIFPYLTFSFTHPLMCKAFKEYTNNLVVQHGLERTALKLKLGNCV